MPVSTGSDSALWVSEYGWILRSKFNRCLDAGNLELRGADFDSLESLLEESRVDDVHGTLPLQYCLRHGRAAFKVQNQVGLIRTPAGTQIEILPKLSRHGTAEQSRRLLVKMLIELENSPFCEAAAADLKAYRMPLFELLLRYYLDQVGHVVRRGIARSYVSRQGNLNQLRGKILVSQNIRHNAANAARFYCEYEEFMADRPINRLIKSGLVITARLTSEPKTQQLCREHLGWFDGVSTTSDWKTDFKRIRWDRNVRHYKKAMPPCRMLHERLNPLTQQGGNRAISMLFPMEKVFEDYVAACLRRQLCDWKIETQKQGHYLVDDHLGQPIFALRPDLLLSNGATRVVADTKWKLIDEQDHQHKYGITQADMYQLFGYGRKILATAERPLVILIYPRSEQFSAPLPDFSFEKDGCRLLVLPFDLHTGQLIGDDVVRSLS